MVVSCAVGQNVLPLAYEWLKASALLARSLSSRVMLCLMVREKSMFLMGYVLGERNQTKQRMYPVNEDEDMLAYEAEKK